MTSSGNVGSDDLLYADSTKFSARYGSMSNSSRTTMPFFVSSPMSVFSCHFHLPTMLAWNVFAAKAGILPSIGFTSSSGLIDFVVLSTNVNALRLMSIDACSKSFIMLSYLPTVVPSESTSKTVHCSGSSSGFGLLC